jgi:hypothetical protein
MVSRPAIEGGLAGGPGTLGRRGIGFGTSGRGGTGFGRWSPGLQLLLFCSGSFLLFYSMPGRTFASDDFLVLERVGMGNFRTPGFFRPLSDLTLYFNYALGGFHPAGYYAVNILLHGINSWLLYRWCSLWGWRQGEGRQGEGTQEDGRQRSYALLAAVLFLAYPFHNEGVAWILGRASITASMFGMAVLVMAVSGFSVAGRIGWACLFYFIGMAGYESVMLLPLMVFVILYSRVSRRELSWWMIALGVTLGIHLVLRILVSGGVAGEYGSHFLGGQLLHYAKNILAVTGRLFFPPMPGSRVLVLFVLLLVLGSIALLVYLRRAGWRRLEWRGLSRLLLLLGIACVVPVFAGVSTHTSESDRFLYFPSYFLCAGISFLLVRLLPGRRWLAGGIAVLLLYEVFFLERNNRNWVMASTTTREVLAVVSNAMEGAGMGAAGMRGAGVAGTGKKVFVVNLPDERDGAYIFRLGLPEALLMQGMDTAGLVVVSHLRRDAALNLPDSLSMGINGALVQLPPDVVIRRMGTDSFRIQAMQWPWDKGGNWEGKRGDIVLFWNRERFLRWEPGK